MAGVNKVILLGRLGRDPEVRTLGSGDKVVNLRIATSETWKDKASGERKEKTEWHSVVIFNEQIGRNAEQYLKKGSEVYIEGQLQTRKWSDNQGVEKYSTEIVLQRFRGEMTFVGGGQGGGGGGGQRDGGFDDEGSSRGGSNRGGGRPSSSKASGGYDLDDDIPFGPEFR